LVADALQDCSNRGDIVLDPFCGSGTTIIAAEKTDRRARCLEIDPLYVDAAIRRWEGFTGSVARHGETGRSFEDTKLKRHSETTPTPLPPDRQTPEPPTMEDPVDAGRL
jgi:hypothetical protein